MIRKLRQRFILVAMLSVFVVLAVIMGSINILNYRKIVSDADHVTEILVENDGSFPRMEPPEKQGGPKENNGSSSSDENQRDTDQLNEDQSNGTADSQLKEKPGDGQMFSAETPYETRYFTVTLSSDGTVTESDTVNIAAITEDQAEEYAQDIYESGHTKGFYKNYRYQVTEEDDSYQIVFVDCQRSLANFYDFMRISLGISAVGFAAVFLMVLILSKYVFRPVEDSYRKQKQFITDAGHELKTPLTIIDANVEVLEMMEGENQWTTSIHHQTKRLANLTAELVELSRLDEERELPMMEFSFSDAVSETAEGFQTAAEATGKTLEIQVEQNLSFTGDEQKIRKLVSVFLDNALKYSDESGQILVKAGRKGKGRYLTVENTAKDQKQGNLNYLFERFYREDASRSSKTAGYGIGLSIAKAIVQAHKGKISARGEENRFIITVEF